MEDIEQYFPHLHRHVEPGLNWGRPYLSDWADKSPDDPVFGIYRKCGFMFPEEAAVLYECAKQIGGRWLDIGCHTGWTALHIAKAGDTSVIALDPMLANQEFHTRALANIVRAGCAGQIKLEPITSRTYFDHDVPYDFDGVVIDGEHGWGGPLYDAVWSLKFLSRRGVIVFHDFCGGPVREAVRYLMCEGFKCRVYFLSQQLLAVCWRGEFVPPDVKPEPFSGVDWAEYQSRFQAASSKYPNGRGDFYFEECE